MRPISRLDRALPKLTRRYRDSEKPLPVPKEEVNRKARLAANLEQMESPGSGTVSFSKLFIFPVCPLAVSYYSFQRTLRI